MSRNRGKASCSGFQPSRAELAPNRRLRFVKLADAYVALLSQAAIPSLERLQKTHADHLEIIEALEHRSLRIAVPAPIHSSEWAESNVETALKASLGPEGPPRLGSV